MKSYQINITVSQDDLDELQHVNNVRYLDWIQQISKEHWQNVTDESLQREFIWVVRKHEITYHSGAQLGDELLLTTTITNSKGAISKRSVIITDTKTTKPVVTSETDWCLVNPTSMKPVRIPDAIKNLFSS